MRKLTGKEKMALVCCTGIWILIAFFLFPHAAWQEEREQIYKEQAATEQELIAVENFINAHGNMDEFYREMEEHQEHSLKAMPEEMEQGRFLEFLQRLALGCHVELLGVAPGEKIQEGDVAILPIRVQLRCRYFQLLDFLKGLQEGDRFLQVRDAKIHSDREGLACEIDLVIFAMRL